MTTDIRERVAELVGSIRFSQWPDDQKRVTDAVVDALFHALPQLHAADEPGWEYAYSLTRDGYAEISDKLWCHRDPMARRPVMRGEWEEVS